MAAGGRYYRIDGRRVHERDLPTDDPRATGKKKVAKKKAVKKKTASKPTESQTKPAAQGD